MTITFPLRHARLGATLVASALIGACATAPKLEERPANGTVKPIEMPAYEVGTVMRQISNTDGEVADWEVIEAGDDGTYVGRNAQGCSWTKDRDPMSPPINWTGCGTGEWSSGERTILSSSGTLWPLAPGNEATWKHADTTSKGSRSSGSRRCGVTGPYAITTRVAGDVDAMKVTCKDPWATLTSWWTAEHGEVRTWRIHNDDGLQYDHELTAVERL